MDRASGSLRTDKERESLFDSGSGVFTEDCGLVYVPTQESKNWFEKGQGPDVLPKSLIPRGARESCH